MRLILAIFLSILIWAQVNADDNKSWSWGGDEKEETPNKAEDKTGTQANEEIKGRNPNYDFLADEQEIQVDVQPERIYKENGAVDNVVDQIISSGREGRNLKEYDEVYSDPNIQDALQNGDDHQARHLIKERLCGLGLMQVNRASCKHSLSVDL